MRKAFVAAKEFVDAHADRQPVVTVNSWDEWTETSCLEPVDLYGYRYLGAFRDVFVSKGGAENEPFVGLGPSRSDPRWCYFDEYDLSTALVTGENVIAVMVLHHGYRTGAQAAIMQMLFAELRVVTANGTKITVGTDHQCRRASRTRAPCRRSRPWIIWRVVVLCSRLDRAQILLRD